MPACASDTCWHIGSGYTKLDQRGGGREGGREGERERTLTLSSSLVSRLFTYHAEGLGSMEPIE